MAPLREIGLNRPDKFQGSRHGHFIGYPHGRSTVGLDFGHPSAIGIAPLCTFIITSVLKISSLNISAALAIRYDLAPHEALRVLFVTTVRLAAKLHS